MHELSLCQSIVEDVLGIAKRNKVKKVQKIRLAIGAMSGVVKESMEFCFPECSRGTLLENADLLIDEVPVKIKCRLCDRQNIVEPFALLCPICSSLETDVIAGKELNIVDLEVL